MSVTLRVTAHCSCGSWLVSIVCDISFFPAQMGIKNPPLNVCRDSISGIVGKFQSARAFPSQRALTIECSPMVGLVKVMNL